MAEDCGLCSQVSWVELRACASWIYCENQIASVIEEATRDDEATGPTGRHRTIASTSTRQAARVMLAVTCLVNL